MAYVKVLIGDEDNDHTTMLLNWLPSRGYEVRAADTAQHLKHVWREWMPDLVIIDVTFANERALTLCRDLQHIHDARILAIGHDGSAQSETQCLEAGADGYLPKPFFPTHLLAMMHALTRRLAQESHPTASSTISIGPITLDVQTNEVCVYNTVTRLTPTEFKVLHVLVANANEVCTLDQIVARTWGYGNPDRRSLIKSHIRRLREKIEPDPTNPRFIVSVPGIGYKLKTDGSPLLYSTMPLSHMQDVPWSSGMFSSEA